MDDLNFALVKARQLDLTRAADAQRLAHLAACCRPAVVRERTSQLVAWFRHGQIGTGIDDLSAAPLTARGCCA